MAIFKLYSQRLKEAQNTGKEDVYQYGSIPAHLRNQIASIAVDAIGAPWVIAGGYGESNPRWKEIERVFLREKGYTKLSRKDEAGDRISEYMAECSTEEWLDLCELICFVIKLMEKENEYVLEKYSITQRWDDALEEINYRMRQAGVGYVFEFPQLMRVDSQFVHSEVVKPALGLLGVDGFSGPAEEFRSAHAHYREGEHRQAVAMAANAMESTFKAIFDRAGWVYAKGARISDLVKVARANGLWPDYLDTSFDQLVATLQSGLPKIRDNDASHGQGAEPKEVPAYVAAYALHLSAAKIVFVVEAARAKGAI